MGHMAASCEICYIAYTPWGKFRAFNIPGWRQANREDRENIMKLVRNLLAFLFLLIFSGAAIAAATVITVKGSVMVTPAKGSPEPLAAGQRIEPGALIKTSANGETTMRFDDGQLLALASNTSFVISKYRFNAHKPEDSNFTGTLLKGGLRAVTGIIGETNKRNVTVKTEVATIGIRGTDFMLYQENGLYFSVLDGAISTTNAGGEALFDAKVSALGMVANADTIGKPAAEEQFPAAALAAFRILQMYPLSDNIRKPNPKDPTCSDRR